MTPSRFNRTAIKVREAQHRIMNHVMTTQEEVIILDQCLHRITALDLYAAQDVPHFRRSGLDGYAFQCTGPLELTPQQPLRLRVVDHVAAGSSVQKFVTTGEAVRIMTGGQVPEGATAVVMFEHTSEVKVDGFDYVDLKHPVRLGQNISKPGEEISSGQLLIPHGTCIGPGHQAVLAAMGYSHVKVHARPKVGIIAIGSELLAVEAPIQPGTIRSTNDRMIAAQVKHYGGIPYHYGILPDDESLVEQTLKIALQEMDIVITSGGVSVGDFDVMAGYFNKKPDELLFNKVLMRPGSPTSAAVSGGTLLIGLSGNPGACFVGFELFVRPALMAMQGLEASLDKFIQAELTVSVVKSSPYDRYEKGRLYCDEGKVYVEPLRFNKSGMMLSIQEANCLFVIPSGSCGVNSGQLVLVIPLSYDPYASSLL